MIYLRPYKLILLGLLIIQNMVYAINYIHNNTDQTITLAFTYEKQDPKSMMSCSKESSQMIEINPKEKKEYYPSTGRCIIKKIFVSSTSDTDNKSVTIENISLTNCNIIINNPSIETPYLLTWTTEIP